MIGKVAWWSNPAKSVRRGYGFIEVPAPDGIGLEKFFCLGSRLLFDIWPEPGMLVEFDISSDKPHRPNGFRLADNIKLRSVIQKGSVESKAAL
jgi:hypothetical protein